MVLALAMVLSLAATAWATVNPDLGTYEGSNDRGHGLDSSNALEIPITKSLIIFNPEDGTVVREPNLKFVYSVTPVTDTALLGTITDDGRYNPDATTGTPVTVKVNAGVAGVVTGVTLPFNEVNTVAAKPTGTEVEKSDNLTVNLANIQHAGVYRYLITETVTDASDNNIALTDLDKYGLEERVTADYETTRYLDLYVANDDANPGEFKLTGAIIFKTNSVDDSNGAATTAITTTTDKTTGFEPGTETPASGDADYTNDTDVDRYFTYNLKVGKTTTGTLADKQNDFPFEIKLTADANLIPTVKTDLTVTGATNETAGVRNIANGSVLTLSPKMSDGDYIELKGIPKGTTVTVKETNNTPDVYTAAWDGMTGTTTADAAVKGYTSANVEKANLSLESSDYAINTTAVALNGGQTVTSGTIGGTYVKTVLGYTNNLAEISPTGVVLRVAPYALMLVAGLFLLFLGKKRQAYEA